MKPFPSENMSLKKQEDFYMGALGSDCADSFTVALW